jgi:NAD(P)-dependent dehydrogenase (short-subunit alcohol dehydrogenase family)
MALISRDFLTKLVRFWDVDAQDWQRMFDVNVRAPFMLAKCASPIMTAQGWGRIINASQPASARC